MTNHLYPLMLDVTDRLMVIVGGGFVGSRKATGLIAAGAKRIRVVSPVFHANMPAAIERIAEEYRPQHLDGAALVFAATNVPEVNASVAADARSRGILMNRADADEGDFTTPAVLHEDAVTIAISAGGSPAITARIRDGIQQTLDRRWLPLAAAMRRLRPEILSANLPEQVRRDLFRDLATEEAADLAMAGDFQALKAKVETCIGRKLQASLD